VKLRPLDGRTKITPPELAARWGIDAHKILSWVRSGELRAIDVSTRRGGKPRYLIDQADIAVFEQRRTVQPPAPIPRRRRKASNIVEYF
jgi:hypothetical protein